MSILQIGFVALVFLSVTWFGIGYWLGARNRNNWWWNEMIRRRHAEHHWEDGKIYWNADLPRTSRDPAATKVAKLTASKP